MVRTKQINNENGAVLNRDFPRRDRSLIMVPEELKRLYPNAKPEHIEMALKRFSDYECGEGESKIELFGTKGGAKMDPKLELYSEMNGYMTDMTLSGIETALDFDVIFQNEINHFVDTIQGRTTCIAPAEDGVMMMKILDGIYESARTGHEVVID